MSSCFAICSAAVGSGLLGTDGLAPAISVKRQRDNNLVTHMLVKSSALLDNTAILMPLAVKASSNSGIPG